MKPVVTKGIILTRVNYSEADRIITFLTPDNGKVTAIAKGVRKSKSKLAGGIELFSVSSISFISGRRDIATLISTRLDKHYGGIVADIERTRAGYELLKLLNKATEEHPEAVYFDLLESAFEALEDKTISPHLVSLWFEMQVLKLSGHTPNLHTDSSGHRLAKERSYDFELDGMRFKPVERNRSGAFKAKHIQFLRVGFSDNPPKVIQRIEGVDSLVGTTAPLVRNMLANFTRI